MHNDVDASLAVIDLETRQILRHIYPGSLWYAACYSEAADKYYCNGGDGSAATGVAVIDGATDSVIKQIRLPRDYLASGMVAVEPETSVMVAAYGSGFDSVYVLDARRDSTVSALVVGRNPAALVYSVSAGVVYCANRSSGNLSVIAADGSRVLKDVNVGDYPQNLLVCPSVEKLYVGHSRQWVYVIRDRVGIAEADAVRLRASTAARFSRGTYWHCGPAASLIDAAGRRITDIMPGHNDLSDLAPGVYVIRPPSGGSLGKVVMLR